MTGPTTAGRASARAVVLLFDTSAVVGLVERAGADARRLITESGERPFVSFVTVAELHVGVRAAATEEGRIHRQRTLQRAMSFRQVPVGRDILDSYASARLAGIRGNDGWIAAAAKQVGATLVTEDETMAARAGAIVDVTLIESTPP